MKKAIIIASFGCSIKESRTKYIEPTEQEIKKNYNDFDCFRVFTSEIIRRKIKREENIDVHNMNTCLRMLKDNGYTHVYVSSTHIIPGLEYEKILDAVSEYKDDFEEIKVARTFLDDVMGEKEADVVMSYVKSDLSSDEAVVLVGHGTDHVSHKYYKQVEELLRKNLSNLYIVNVEGDTYVEEAIAGLKKNSIRKIYLYPFMLVAGDHAFNDIASDDEESIKTLLKSHGFDVEAFITGLGAQKKASELFADRLRECM